MSNRAQSHFLRVYEGSTDHGLFQNYYVNQTVTYSPLSEQQSVECITYMKPFYLPQRVV